MVMTEREFIDKIKKEMDGLDNSFIYYPLKEYGVKKIHSNTLNVLKCCIVLKINGVKYITVNLISAILDRDNVSTTLILRGLGDKNVLDLKGYMGKQLAYVIHDEFIKGLKIEGV